MGSAEGSWDWDDGPEGRDPDSGVGELAAWAVVDLKAVGPGGLADVFSPALIPRNDSAKAVQS